MHRRCYDSEYHSYHRYGGRGICVCPEWQEWKDFEAVFEKIWQPGMSLDRIDDDLPYTPSNVRAVHKSLNTKPRRINYQELMELRAQGISYKKLAEHFGVSLSAVSAAAYKVRNGKAEL
jgi:DNA-directed RNA polymerase specialized sigma24 family protein